jgi:hypothetical protein
VRKKFPKFFCSSVRWLTLELRATGYLTHSVGQAAGGRENFAQNRHKWQQDSVGLLLIINKLSLTINKSLQFATKLVLFGLDQQDLRSSVQEIGRYAMRNWVRSSMISRFAGVITAAWLCGMASAWAGTSGSDTGLQQALNDVCADVGISTTSCPHMPTATQAILQMSGLTNAAPDFVRGPQGPVVASGFSALCTVTGSGGLNVCSQKNAINAVNPPAASPVSISDLAPLAFTTVKGQAVPVPFGTKGAASFFYAVATGPNGEPNMLTVVFDYPTLTSSSFTKGQVVANVSLPLQVLKSDGSERPICGAMGCPATLATLQITACSNGSAGCVNGLLAKVSGDFTTAGTPETRDPGSLGIQPTVSFNPSPNSDRSHFMLEVQVPLLITLGNDPAYFGVVPSGVIPVNELSGLPTAFTAELKPTFGVNPQAAPTCSGPCPSTTFTSTFPFCASFAGNGGGPINPAVATFVTLGTDATTYVSSPVTTANPMNVPILQCPF